MPEQYYFDKRPLKNRIAYYVRFINLETGEVLPHRSVERLGVELGLLKHRQKVTKEKEAHKICTIALERNAVFLEDPNATFIKFALDYWDYGGDRVRRKNRLSKGSVHTDHVVTMHQHIERYVKPKLPKNLPLKKVAPRHIEAVVNALVDEGKLANATIFKIRQSMTAPLKYAYKKKMIPSDPTIDLEPIDVRTENPRGTITISELRRLMEILGAKPNRHAYLACGLSAATGMRQGEIIALHVGDIEIVNDQDAIITIGGAFAKRHGFKDPKGKRERAVPVSRPIAEALLRFASFNTRGNDLIFWSFTSTTRPISAGYITKAFNDAMADLLEEQSNMVGKMIEDEKAKEAGITDDDGKPIMMRAGEKMRKDRNIVFHSLRHFFVSQLRGNVDDTLLRLTSGHQSEGMSDTYTHMEYEKMKPIADLSRNIVIIDNPNFEVSTEHP